MLDKNSIAQLSQLKQDILASKDVAEGTVVGTAGRFGFVKLDDGRTAFLNPEKMQKVLPGDRVRVNVVRNAKDQLEADFEAFLAASLTRFVGQYRIKGNAHFVAPTDKGVNRWIFLPPQNRPKCKEGDYVLAEIAKHPFDDGKAAAKIISHIGAEGSNFLHHNIVIAKYGLSRFWAKDAMAQAKSCESAAVPETLRDLTHLPLVTIDSASTKDMDDALCTEAVEGGGWKLWVSIADPASFIAPGSFIAKSARYFSQTVYLPGRVLPMLPEGLATGAFSLQPEQLRAAITCEIDIAADGTLTGYEFSLAKIQSQKKLTYQQVAAWLDGDEQELSECSDAIKDSIKALYDCATVRCEYRQKHHFVADDQADFDWTLNKQGFIESITKRARNKAHRLVEEAMVAANLCGGEFLAKNNTGIFATQTGFRPERLGEVKALLREELGEDFSGEDIDTPEGFLKLMHHLRGDDSYRHLLAPLRRFTLNAELADKPLPHLGMGVMHYAPITSPIRRYADLCNHWSIHQLLKHGKPQSQPAKLLEQLLLSLDNSRQASRELEQTLVCEYLSRHLDQQSAGTIRIVTQQGFGVRLNDTGMEGFVQIPKQVEKTFDAKRMTLTVADTCYALDAEVSVRVAAVDREKRRVKLELTDAPWASKTAASTDAKAEQLAADEPNTTAPASE